MYAAGWTTEGTQRGRGAATGDRGTSILADLQASYAPFLSPPTPTRMSILEPQQLLQRVWRLPLVFVRFGESAGDGLCPLPRPLPAQPHTPRHTVLRGVNMLESSDSY